MRLKYNETARGKCFYIIRSVYKNGKNTSETYEKLGYLDEVKEKHHCDDPEKWMRDYLDQLNEREKAEKNIKMIEESFRIMKDEFHSRPAYVSRPDRIKAHFMTCFIALLVYRILERKLGNKYTCDEIVSALRSMGVTKAKDLGFIPSYTRTNLTDSLHESAGFRTDYEITRDKAMRGIVRKSKQR